MERLDPGIRIGKALGIEFVRTPGIGTPVLPILHDVVEGNLPLAELPDHIERLIGCLVALPRLPQAEDPVRHHGRLAGKQTIAVNDPVSGRAVDKVIVGAFADLRPQRGVGVRRGRLPQEVQGILLFGIVFNADWVLVAGFKMDSNLVIRGKPVLPPVVHHQFAVEPYLDAAIRVGLKLIVAGCGSENGANPRLRLQTPRAGSGFRMIGLGSAQTETNGNLRGLPGRLRSIDRRNG